MPNPEEVTPLPDFFNQSALEKTQGNDTRDVKKTNTRMMMMMMMMESSGGGGRERPPPLLEYNH